MESFKNWMEGEYGTSAYGFVGAWASSSGNSNPQGANDETFAKQGVKSNYTAVDMQKKLPPKNRRQPLGNISARIGV
jgi:hypothetical protein